MMTTKHPERQPVDQVEGAIRVDPAADQRFHLKPSSHDALQLLVQHMVRAAERKLREQSQATDYKASAA